MELKPGYKQTDIGVVPEDWEARQLQKTCRSIYRGASPRPIDSPRWFDVRSTIGWVRIADVTQARRYLTHTTQYLSGEGVIRSRLLPSGSLIMSICATVGRPIETQLDACIHDGFVVFERPLVDQSYLYYMLCDLEPRWSKKGQTGSQMNLNTELIKITFVPIPTTEDEQRAIAAALTDVDALLDGLDRLIAKKRDLKQAAMQQLLTGRTRLPGFGEEWDVKRLDQLAGIVMGQSPDSGYYNRVGDGVPLIQGNDDIVDRRSIARVWTSKVSKRGLAGDVLLTVRAPVGEVSIASEDCCLGRGVCSLRASGDQSFLFHAMVFAEAVWRALEQGSTFTAANSAQVAAFSLRVPLSQAEQAAIAEVLSGMDAEIDTLEARRDKTRLLKQAMMQELLTGRTRLVDTQGATA